MFNSPPSTGRHILLATVYCFPPQWGDGYEQVQVIAHHRGSPRLVMAIIPVKVLTDCRAKLVHRPAVIERFEGQWDESDKSRKLAEGLAAILTDRRRSNGRKAEGD